MRSIEEIKKNPKTEDLIGREVFKVEVVRGDEELIFHTDIGKFRFCHWQVCCENVYIESITGDLNDLIGTILRAEEKEGDSTMQEWSYQTWTFYTFATKNGYVDIRWLGESNGYYSESVDLEFIPDE